MNRQGIPMTVTWQSQLASILAVGVSFHCAVTAEGAELSATIRHEDGQVLHAELDIDQAEALLLRLESLIAVARAR